MTYFLYGCALGMLVFAFIAHSWEVKRREKELENEHS